jgi:uncharacterized protein (TIGR02301 family)
MSARRLPRSLSSLTAALMLAAVSAMPASAQDGRYERLVELAAVLGEAHAIRTVCNGDNDQTWRNYMMSMIDLEAPTGPRKSSLTSAFNRGFRTQSGRTSSCTSDLVQVEAAIAARGRAIADAVAASYLE